MAVNRAPERRLDVGTEVLLPKHDDFLKIKETLTRVGIANERNELRQVCFLLHKQGRYYILHHKELLQLDGFDVEIDSIDIERRLVIVRLLTQWGLITRDLVDNTNSSMAGLKVVPFRDKAKWKLITTYNIGKVNAVSSKRE